MSFGVYNLSSGCGVASFSLAKISPAVESVSIRAFYF